MAYTNHPHNWSLFVWHNNDIILSAMVSQITGVSIVCSTVGPGADQRKHQSSASLAFVRGIHCWPVNSPHKRPVTRKMFPSDDVIMTLANFCTCTLESIHSQHILSKHYSDVIMGLIASQITSLAVVYSTVYSDADKKNPSKLRVTGLCAGNSPVTGEFPAQMASNAENVSIWWRHHDF